MSAALGGLRAKKGQRQEDLDLAHRIARDHRGSGQPRAVARDDAQAQQPLARRRAAAAHLEQREPAVAQDEEADQPEYLEELGSRRYPVAELRLAQKR